jgi:hypothetical protein
MTEPLIKPFAHPVNDTLMRALFFPNEFSPEECQRLRAIPADADLTRPSLPADRRARHACLQPKWALYT